MVKKLNTVKGFRVCLVLALTMVWALFAGFFRIFSFLAVYDDEGYLMLTVRQFLDGKLPYNEVYLQYGPVYYFYKYAFFSSTGLALTHDVTRISTLIVWALTAFGCGIFAFRITRSALFSAVSYILSFVILARTVAEPGHPQDICGLIIVSILLLFIGEKNMNLKLVVAAALLAVLLLIKINLGIFVGLALLLAILTVTTGRVYRIILVIETAAVSLLPFLLFRKYFEFGWLRLSIVFAAALIAACVVSLKESTPIQRISIRTYLLMAVSFLTTAALIILLTISTGVTLDALIDGIFLQHLKFGDDFFQWLMIKRFSAYWAIIALSSALAFAFLKDKRPQAVDHVAIALKILFGIAVIICSLIDYNFLNEILLLSFATPFLWLLLLRTGENDDKPNYFLPKAALVFTSILLTLQVFPIPGTQMAYATFLMTIVGVISLSDGLSAMKDLRTWQPFTQRIPTAISASLFIVILGFCVVWAYQAYSQYYRRVPLDLPGASLVRLPEQDVENYRSIVQNINENCDNFVSMPGLNSFYFWTQKDPPTTLNAGPWMSLLDEQQQRSVVRNIESIPRLCAVYDPELTQYGAQNRDLAKLPLSSFILKDFRTVSTVGNFRFMVRNESNP
jgi:hypothetical protein